MDTARNGADRLVEHANRQDGCMLLNNGRSLGQVFRDFSRFHELIVSGIPIIITIIIIIITIVVIIVIIVVTIIIVINSLSTKLEDGPEKKRRYVI